MEAFWEPSRERHDWVDKEAAIFSWENEVDITMDANVDLVFIHVQGV